jgi:hypothetical protein
VAWLEIQGAERTYTIPLSGSTKSDIFEFIRIQEGYLRILLWP